MTDNTLPTAEYVRKRLAYDPDTGVFVWRHCETSRVQWNACWAGRVAGRIDGNGYSGIGIAGIRHQAHRLAWLITHGEWPADQIDHINGDRADNRLVNLRSVTSAENKLNMARPKNNTSGIVGVRWHKVSRKWEARIRVDGRLIHLGSFTDIADAAECRKAAEIAHGFHPNHGRVALIRKSG